MSAYSQDDARYDRATARKGGLPELPRSISTTNLETTARCRSIIKQDWCPVAVPNGTNFFTTTTRFTFTLPSLSGYPPDFQKFTFERIVDRTTLEDLEADRCLNWSPSLARLTPLYTMGDGNCLLHAASLAMWGFQDRDFILRNAVYAALKACDPSSPASSTLYQRWRLAKEAELQSHRYELEPAQWQGEWRAVVEQSSTELTYYGGGGAAGGSLASLEEFHVFVLSNILKRPIIMYSSSKVQSAAVGGATLQPATFYGIYLPLLWDSRACAKDPLSLAFNAGHFSALVVFEDEAKRNEFLLPLMDYNRRDLPVRFMHPSENSQQLVKEYFDTEVVVSGSAVGKILCAKLKVEKVPAYISTLITGFIDACSNAFRQFGGKDPYSTASSSSSSSSSGRVLCLNGCGLYGDMATQGFCSRCFKEQVEKKQQPRPPTLLSSGQPLPSSAPLNRTPSQPTASIKCPSCSNQGHPNFLGMCQACFQSQQSAGDPPLVPRSSGSGDQNPVAKPPGAYLGDSKGGPPMPQYYGGGAAYSDRRRCSTPNCEFYGTAETNFYCSKCSKLGAGNPLPSQQPRPVPAPRIITQPQGTSGGGGGGSGGEGALPHCNKCHNFCGSPEYGGLCHSCFMDQTKEDSRKQRSGNGSGLGAGMQADPPALHRRPDPDPPYRRPDPDPPYRRPDSDPSYRRPDPDPPYRRPDSDTSYRRLDPDPTYRRPDQYSAQQERSPPDTYSSQGRSDLYGPQKRSDPHAAAYNVGDYRPNDLNRPMEQIALSDRGGASCFACEKRDPALQNPQTVFTVCYTHAIQLTDVMKKSSQPEFRTAGMEQFAAKNIGIGGGGGGAGFGPIGGSAGGGAGFGPIGGSAGGGKRAQQAYGGGSHLEATGGSGATYAEKPPKLICKTPGCSFRGVTDLDGLCPNCYRDKGGQTTLKAE